MHAPDPLDIPLKLQLARWTHGVSPSSLALAFADWLQHAGTSPAHQAAIAASAVQKWLALLNYSGAAWHGDCPACVHPAGHDKRFDAPQWDLPPFNVLAQGFLLAEQWWQEAMTGVHGVSQHHEDVAAFATRQWLDMWSPSNFVATNPQVLQATLAQGGANLAAGAMNWARDAAAVLAQGKPRGVDAFMPGRGTALTPGSVVFRNSLVELIRYDSTTADVWAEPVLVVPSWIMKFYILDLTPGDSLVEYLVGQGHTVYMVSWRNPGGTDRELGMDDYLQSGVIEPVDAIRRMQPGCRVHAAGYCLGGTLLAIAAALLCGHARNPLKSVSLLAAQADFHEPGELGLFMDESQIAFLEAVMAERGYLDGRQMAGAFQLINSKDLVWSKLVHEYLMGAQSPMTAMRAWNADATRLPARMHSEYLRSLYLRNDLAEGRYLARGRVARLDAIRLPLFLAATESDHVSPWRSVYKIHQLVRSKVTMALSSGGHNVGIVSPPTGPMAHAGASYRIATHDAGRAPADPQAWRAGAQRRAGSWWPAWADWLARHSSRRIRPPVRRVLRDELSAPGSYVLERCAHCALLDLHQMPGWTGVQSGMHASRSMHSRCSKESSMKANSHAKAATRPAAPAEAASLLAPWGPWAEQARQQMSVAAEGACAVFRGFESIRHIQERAAHEALQSHEAAARKLKGDCRPADLANIQSNLLRFDMESAVQYWQQLAAAAMEMQAQLMDCGSHLLPSDGLLETASAMDHIPTMAGLSSWLGGAADAARPQKAA